jgi:hypothetical protein
VGGFALLPRLDKPSDFTEEQVFAMKILISQFLVLVALGHSVGAAEPGTPGRLDEVIARGARVMPFSLDKTLHVFSKTETGGCQQVLAKDAGDAEQIRLIREHLSSLAARFAEGDFSDPDRIHGREMPGLTALRAGARQVRFDYRELPNGAQLVYSTPRPALAAAIHRYFDAQLSDHARHATTGHAHGHQP